MPERVRAWIDWFGLTRLVTSAVAVVIVCLGGFWLLRAPAPPSEAALPFAAPATSSPPVTLEPPTSVAPLADADAASSTVVVHVAGSVSRPGVYRLEAGTRIDDAIAAAGGALGDADIDLLNLAAPLADGTRVYVPLVGEEVATALVVEAAPPVSTSSGAPTGPVNVNEASATELETLPGVGPATALAIVTERERNGPFASVDDLDRVPGIGPAKLAAFGDLVTT